MKNIIDLEIYNLRNIFLIYLNKLKVKCHLKTYFENIKDEFYYGKFGEFTLIVDKSTGFFNWYRLERTKSLFNEIIKSCPSHVKGNFSYENKGISNNSKIGIQDFSMLQNFANKVKKIIQIGTD